MSDLNFIGPHALGLLNNLEEFYCTYNNKLTTIDPSAFSYKLNNESNEELWPNIVKVYESKTDILEYFSPMFFLLRRI